MQNIHRATLSTHALSLSTILFASAMSCSAATAREPLSPPKIEPKQSFYREPAEYIALPETDIGVVTPVREVAYIAPKQRVLRTLWSYEPGHPEGDTSIVTNRDHIVMAERIIESLPAGFPIPWANRNDDGEIGLYWDDDDAYADIDIDAEGSISFYSKLRSTGEEEFLSDIMLSDFTAEWAKEHLALLLHKFARAV